MRGGLKNTTLFDNRIGKMDVRGDSSILPRQSVGGESQTLIYQVIPDVIYQIRLMARVWKSLCRTIHWRV